MIKRSPQIKLPKGIINMDDFKGPTKAVIWGLGVFLLVIVVMTIFSGYLREYTVDVERQIYEKSYQKVQGDAERINMLEAELAGVNAGLNDPETTDEERAILRRQKAMLEVQLNSARENHSDTLSKR
jgi:hypothetical protein